MRSFRALSAAAAILAIIGMGLLALSSPRASDSVPSLSGLVRDRVGNAVDGVRILILAGEEDIRTPVAETSTSQDGRFVMADLRRGAYRVVAVKDGYMTALERVDTFVRSNLNLVLHPIPSEAELDRPLPEDSSWVLRLPKRSLLRDVDGAALLGLDDEGGRGGNAVLETAASLESLRGELQHLFAVAGGLGADPDGPLDVLGNDTRLGLFAPLTERGAVRIRGHRERIATAPDSDPLAIARREATALRLDLGYDTSLDARLDVRAFYDQGSLTVPVPPSVATARRAQRSWGYDATWATQLTSASRLELRMDYQDSDLRLPGALEGDAEVLDPSSRRITNRMVGAGGSYESVPSRNHKLRVGLRAQRFELPIPRLRASAAASTFGTFADPGWSVRIDAEDAWAVSRPVTFVYGLAYHQALQSDSPPIVIPKAGAVWNAPGMQLRMVLSYPTRAAEERVLRAPEGRSEPDPLGYEVAVETHLPVGLQLSGSREYRPILAGRGAGDTGNLADWGPAVVTDGRAAILRDSLRLERAFGDVRTFVRVNRSRAEGWLAAVPVIEAPVHVLGHRALHFAGGEIGVQLPASGTEILAEYQVVEEATPSVSPFSQRAVELSLAQHLMWLDASGASWKLKLIARTASTSTHASSAEIGAGGLDLAALTALHRQLSAGVSVAF